MIKGKSKIYNLGGLTDLFTERYRQAWNCIDEKEFSQRLEKFLLGEKAEVPSNLHDYVSRYWNENYKYYTDIISSFERIYQSYAYLCKFPRFRYYNFYYITEFSWLRYHIEYYLQENYVLRERTISWIGKLKDIAKRKSETDLEKALAKISKIFDKLFNYLKKGLITLE